MSLEYFFGRILSAYVFNLKKKGGGERVPKTFSVFRLKNVSNNPSCPDFVSVVGVVMLPQRRRVWDRHHLPWMKLVSS